MQYWIVLENLFLIFQEYLQNHMCITFEENTAIAITATIITPLKNILNPLIVFHIILQQLLEPLPCVK